MQIIFGIFVLFAMSAIAEGMWAAAARGLYQPILLSVGTVFAAFNSKSSGDYLGSMVDKFINKSTKSTTQTKDEIDEYGEKQAKADKALKAANEKPLNAFEKAKKLEEIMKLHPEDIEKELEKFGGDFDKFWEQFDGFEL